MPLNSIKTLAPAQKIAVSLLWNQEYPAQVILEKMIDLDQYLAGLTDVIHFLYTTDHGEILGWAFKFKRNGEMWFAVILDSSIHHLGIGTLLLNTLKEGEETLNGWVIDHERYKKSNGKTYHSPLPFYLKNGFLTCTEIRMEFPHLSAVKITWKNS